MPSCACCLGAGLLLLAGCGGGGAVASSAASDPTLSSVGLSARTVTIAVGGTFQLHASPKDQFGLPMSTDVALTYTTSNAAIATVDGTGLVTAVAPGTATVTASATVDGVTQTSSCEVTVELAPLPGTGTIISTAGFAFSPSTVTIAVNDSVSWRFVEAPHNVTFAGIAPSAGNVPTQQPGALVTRVFSAAGTYSYECSLHSGMRGQVVVQSAQAAVYTSLALTPSTPAVGVGGTVSLVATPLDQNGSAMTGLGTPTFTTSAPTVAAVSPAGVVTGAAGGTATITASLTAAGVTHTATATVTVTAPQPGNVTVTTPNQTFSPPTVTIAPGGTVLWQFSGSTHNVTFAGSAPAGGNIPDTQPGNAVARTFTAPGTYSYECSRHNGMTGQVVVQSAQAAIYTSLALTPSTPAVGVGDGIAGGDAIGPERQCDDRSGHADVHHQRADGCCGESRWSGDWCGGGHRNDHRVPDRGGCHSHRDRHCDGHRATAGQRHGHHPEPDVQSAHRDDRDGRYCTVAVFRLHAQRDLLRERPDGRQHP